MALFNVHREHDRENYYTSHIFLLSDMFSQLSPIHQWQMITVEGSLSATHISSQIVSICLTAMLIVGNVRARAQCLNANLEFASLGVIGRGSNDWSSLKWDDDALFFFTQTPTTSKMMMMESDSVLVDNIYSRFWWKSESPRRKTIKLCWVPSSRLNNFQ